MWRVSTALPERKKPLGGEIDELIVSGSLTLNLSHIDFLGMVDQAN